MGFLSIILSVLMLMAYKGCFISLIVCHLSCRPLYVCRSQLTFSLQCKLLHKLAQPSPQLTLMSVVWANIMLHYPLLLSRMTAVTLLWSLAMLPFFMADATHVASLGTRQYSAPRVKRQLPTLLPTNKLTAIIKVSLSLTICNVLLVAICC